MEQLNDYADARLLQGCIYCGGKAETRDHVPSKVFLDDPFPENLPVVRACLKCNNGYSLDEEYVGCLVEAVIAGSVDPERIKRISIGKKLANNPQLRQRLAAAINDRDGKRFFEIETERVNNIVLKLARGHAAYELSLPLYDPPKNIRVLPLCVMEEFELEEFESFEAPEVFGEVGSRGMQRFAVMQMTLRSATGELIEHSVPLAGWVEVQDGRYRYLATSESSGARVRIVISEFLACDVRWS